MSKLHQTEPRPTSVGLDPIIDAPSVARYLGKSVATVAQLRYLGTGPKFLRVGRSIRYRASDVEAWLHENTHTSTTDAAAEAV